MEVHQRKKKYKIGYLSGTFDLFHIGHLEYLNNAKAYCEKLVVGVNDDNLVLEYKKRMPVIPCGDRIEIISALKCVDCVLKSFNRDKIEAYNNVKFDVLFMSEDWKGSNYYSNIESDMKKVGADVIWLPYKNEVSSLLIIKKAMEIGIKLYNDKVEK